MADGSHYYDKQGNPRHGATMREVKKEGLLISVTTYLSIINKPGLEKWKLEERLKLANEIMKDHPDLSYDEMKQCVSQMFEERHDAADRGTKAHDILDLMVSNAVPIDGARDFFYAQAKDEIHSMWGSIEKAYRWFNDVVVVTGKTESTITNLDDCYAGKLDFSGGICSPDMDPKHQAHGIIDWKTQGVKRPG